MECNNYIEKANLNASIATQVEIKLEILANM